MKLFWKLPLLAGALALTYTLAGCGNNAEQAPPTDTTMTLEAENSVAVAKGAKSGTATTEAPPMSGNMDNMAATNSVAMDKGAVPGTATMAGPFEVTLALDAPEPKVGDAQFKATITRDGKPVTDATVKLELSMPQMSMGGPNVTLAHTEGGVYAGKANLGMGGAYSAKVNVMANTVNRARGAMGEAVYEFRAVQ